jgi:hypothetical protein
VPPLADQENGTTGIYSRMPTPMDWTRTIATAILGGHAQSTQQNEMTQPLQPMPQAVQSPKAPSKRPTRAGTRRGVSVKRWKTADSRRKKTRKCDGWPQKRRHAPSQSTRVSERTSPNRRRLPQSKSVNDAQEVEASRQA